MIPDLPAAIAGYREPSTGAVSVLKNPPDHSCDNLPLFWATYLTLLRNPPEAEISRFTNFIHDCEIEPGRYGRYPGDQAFDSWDNLVGILRVSWQFGLSFSGNILSFAIKSDWDWDNDHPMSWSWRGWLPRVLVFTPTIRAANHLRLGMVSQILAAFGYLFNCFEKREETSGKCLLYLAMPMLQFHGGALLDFAISLWLSVMSRRYPGGPKEMYSIYFGSEHPFAIYGPTAWT